MKISNKIYKLLVIIFILNLQACSFFQHKTVQCGTIVKYSGYSVTLIGLDVPVGGQDLFKIGRLDIQPQQINEALELTQALDLLQFSDCQFALLVPKEQIITIRERREATLKALAEVLQALNSAPTAEAHKKVIVDGQAKLSDLQSEAHKQSEAKP